MKIKKINVVFVYVEDVEKAKDFYSNVLGFGKPAVDNPFWVEWKLPEGSDFAICKASDERLEGTVPARSTVKFSMVVDDIRKAYADLFELGVRLVSEPQQGSGFLYLEFQDLDGNVLRLLQWVKSGEG
ncbi:VOC family protein [bacterium]|nr:VOC family protein [bacterium]